MLTACHKIRIKQKEKKKEKKVELRGLYKLQKIIQKKNSD